MAPFHIIAGALGLVGGAVALYAPKGARLHRTSGLIAVYALLIMSMTGVWLAVSRHVEANAIGGVLTGYLIFTALRTVERQARSHWADSAAMVAAFAFGLACITFGFATLAAGKNRSNGVPVTILLVFGCIALLASSSDWRWIRSTGMPDGRSKIVRHLWRMCFGLFIASSSFFLGPDSRVPEPLRIPSLRAVLAFLPLGVMFYWLARVGRRGTSEGTFSDRLEFK
jgi:uncharacterized membrane protein